MSLITLYVSGEITDIVDFFGALNSYCVLIGVPYSVVDPLGICSYDLNTPEKSDLFYAEMARLLGVYNSLNFTIV